MRQTVEYNDSLDRYIIGYKIGKTYVMAPIMMTPEEYRKWTEKRSFTDYYRSKNQEILREKGKDKFDFTDMHFSLGPAEKIFGRIRSVEFSLRSSYVIGVVRCTFQRGCSKESGIVSSSISTSIGFAFLPVSGGATI